MQITNSKRICEGEEGETENDRERSKNKDSPHTALVNTLHNKVVIPHNELAAEYW